MVHPSLLSDFIRHLFMSLRSVLSRSEGGNVCFGSVYLKKGNYLSLSIPYLVFLKNAFLMPNSQLCPEVKKIR